MRVILPEPLKHLSGFASLNVDWLAPLDTITSTLQTTGGTHGTFTMSFALSAQTLSDISFKVNGSSGQATLAIVGNKMIVTITNSKEEAEVSEYIMDGVPAELAGFVNVVNGVADDGLGDPLNALKDAALMQAAFNSRGSSIDLIELVKM
jgi:hypothetical protein